MNNDKNPAQRQVQKPLKRGRRKQIGNPGNNNDKKTSSFDGKIDMYIDMDMDSGEEMVNNKTKLKENGPSFSRGIVKIVNGCNSKRGAVPWQTILEDINCATLCGGTQINLKFILTAAHCIDQFKQNPRKICPKKLVKKKVKPYPNNINSKYVLYFSATQSKKVHIIIIETIVNLSPFFILMRKNNKTYLTLPIITCSLYILNPLFVGKTQLFKGFSS